MTRIVVTGATGGLGSSVVEQLLRLSPRSLLAVSVRNPDAARHLSERGVGIRRGDFDEPASLAPAFEGAERLLIVSTRADNRTRIVQHRNAIDAAHRAGVRHVYYTSIVQRPGSVFAPARGHFDTENYLAASGPAWTIFRNGQYIENLPMFLAPAIATGALALPPDGPTAWVARQDLAEGIARVMIEGGRERESLLLTGPEALDFAQIVAIAARILGRRIARRTISAARFKEMLAARGLSRDAARVLASGFVSRAAGELAAVDPTLADLLGRPLKRVEDVLPDLLGPPSSSL
jgi:NAD(P)H dehydrogenase (quinone)